MKSVCVFCGSSLGDRDAFHDAARELGREIANRRLRLVYGGGNIGLMGLLADAAMEAGGDVVGVIPQALVDKEVAHHGVSELIVVESMHERKARMADLSDGFIALPGGFGTFEEFCEIVTWAQLSLHRKPCGILNTEGYYNPLLELFDRAVARKFLRMQHRAVVLEGETPGEMLDELARFHPTAAHKWIDREET